MTKNKLSIFLIKDSIKDTDDIIIEGVRSFSIDNIGQVFYGYSSSVPPLWFATFFQEKEELNNVLKVANSRVVLLVNIIHNGSDRIFAVVFGYGRNLIKDNVVEERFGIITALNLISPNSIRHINKTNIGGTNKSSREQMPKQSTINDFEFNIDMDLINGISGKSKQTDYIDGIVSGSDLFSATVSVDLDNIVDFLERLYIVYKSDDYKNGFDWIDQIYIVKNKSIIDVLDNKIIESISNNDERFWMAVPELIEWENVKGFRHRSGSDNVYEDIILEEVLSEMKTSLNKIEQLKSKTIEVIGQQSDDVVKTFNAYKCIYGEITLDDKAYCISNGKWFEINQEYSSKIKSQYELTPISGFNFINCEKNWYEYEYNDKLSITNENYIKMDMKLILYGGSHSSIELCDVLTTSNQLIHIKQYSGSSVLSHLFNQAIVSAELIRTDSNFIELANKKILENTKDIPYEIKENVKYEIIFGIISKEDVKLPNIPFFSKISFANAVRRLKGLGFSYSIANIKRESN